MRPVNFGYLVRLRCRFLRVLGMIDWYKTILHSLVAATSLASLTLSVPLVPARVEVALCHTYVEMDTKRFYVTQDREKPTDSA